MAQAILHIYDNLSRFMYRETHDKNLIREMRGRR